MSGFGKRDVDATVIVDTAGDIVWVELENGLDDDERIIDGHELESGQREVKLRMPFDHRCFDAEKLMKKIRAKLDDLEG